MIFIVYDSAQTPVQILLFDLWILFSSDLQSVTRTDNRTKTNAAAVTLTNDNNYHLDYYSHLRFDRLNSSLQEHCRRIPVERSSSRRYATKNQSIDELIDLYQSEIDLCH